MKKVFWNLNFYILFILKFSKQFFFFIISYILVDKSAKPHPRIPILLLTSSYTNHHLPLPHTLPTNHTLPRTLILVITLE